MVAYINGIQQVLVEETRKKIEKERQHTERVRFIVDPLSPASGTGNHDPAHLPQVVRFKARKSAPPPDDKDNWKDPNIGTAIDYIA